MAARSAERAPGKSRTMTKPTARGRPTGGAEKVSLPLGDRVYTELKSLIVIGEIKQGAIFNEAAVAARFAVSTSPVKEALSRLRQDGLVRVIGRRGYAVTELTLQDFHELIEIRVVLEGAACELAAPRVTDAHVAELRRLSAVRLDVTDLRSRQEFTQANQGFHELIPEIAGNARLLRAIRVNFVDMQRMLCADMARGDEVELVNDHDEIIDALARREPRQARDAMFRHIIQARDRALDRMTRRHGNLQNLSVG